MLRPFLLAASLALASLLHAEDVHPLRVLMVTGGCCHDYENQKHILAEGISARANVEFTIVHEEAMTADGKVDKAAKTHRISIYEKDDWAKGYDVILHNECFGGILDVPFVERIAKAHFDGVPGVVLHCSTHSYRMAKTDEWRKVIGQSSFSHEKRRDLHVMNVYPDHPVMKGFPLEWLDKDDELYKNEKLWDNFVPLAKAYGEDTKKDHFLIWVNSYGKARIFGTTMGHTNETMSDPVYLDLVTRGLLWACHKLDDNGKPLAGYEAKQK